MTGESATRLALARSLKELGRLDEAIEVTSEILAGDPTNLSAMGLQAVCLSNLRRDADALAVTTRMIHQDPNGVNTLFIHAQVLMGCRKLREARDVIQRCVQLAPEFPNAREVAAKIWLASANQFWRSERKQRQLLNVALEHSAAAIELVPSAAQLHATHASVLHAKALVAWSKRSPLAEAEASARNALSIDANNAKAHLVLGDVAQTRGKFRDAGDHYVSAGRVDPRDDQAGWRLRLLHLSPALVLLVFAAYLLRAASWLGLLRPTLWLLAALVVAVIVGAIVVKRKVRSELTQSAAAVLDAHRELKPSLLRRRFGRKS